METGKWKMETGKSKTEGESSNKGKIVSIAAAAKQVRDFKDLEVWQTARQLRREMYGVAKSLPDVEKFGLASQIRRAAVSVTANIAEGYGRFGYQENAQMCRQARGSLYELRDHLTTCVDEGYLGIADAKRLDALIHSVTRLLNGYLRSTLARKQMESGK
ncbi:MAG: four helix bundle protein [Terriglobia bacterium]